MASINARLEKLEQQNAGPRRIFVRYGDGPYKSFNAATGESETFTAEEIEARYPDSVLLRVVYASTALAEQNQIEGVTQ